MRKIKFRAWHKNNKSFYDPFREWDWNWSNPFEDKDLICTQFTGLKDRKKKEIYEGDLLRNINGRICKVEWHKKSAGWDYTPVNDIGDSLGFLSTQVDLFTEVIGNIYENKELLK